MRRIILLSAVLLLSVACSTPESCRRIDDIGKALTKAGMMNDYSADYKMWYASYKWEALSDTEKVHTVNTMAKLRNECMDDQVVYVYRAWTANMLAESVEVGRVRLKGKSGWEDYFILSPH